MYTGKPDFKLPIITTIFYRMIALIRIFTHKILSIFVFVKEKNGFLLLFCCLWSFVISQIYFAHTEHTSLLLFLFLLWFSSTFQLFFILFTLTHSLTHIHRNEFAFCSHQTHSNLHCWLYTFCCCCCSFCFLADCGWHFTFQVWILCAVIEKNVRAIKMLLSHIAVRQLSVARWRKR